MIKSRCTEGSEVGFGGGVREALHELNKESAILVFKGLGAHGVVMSNRVASGVLHSVRDALDTGVEDSGRKARTESADLGHVQGALGLGPGQELGGVTVTSGSSADRPHR